MKDIEKLFGTAVNEIERMLNTKTIVGDPITVEGNTLIPLLSVGFGFGVGGGEGTDPSKCAGTGARSEYEGVGEVQYPPVGPEGHSIPNLYHDIWIQGDT